MRSFASVPPTIWQIDVKKLRGDAEAVAIYFHLLTSPHSTMIGIYPLSLGYMALDLGIPLEGASKGLRRVCDAGLATYDEETEIVWVHDMSVSQVAPRLAPKDNKVSSVAKQLEMLPICPITLSFYGRFRDLYHLRDQLILEEFERVFRSPFEAPSEPLRSKEKDKEQEKDLGEGKGQSGSGEKKEVYTHARENEDSEEPYDQPASLEEGRADIVQLAVPPQFIEAALQRHMHGKLFPCDVDNWQAEARGAA